MKMGALLKIVSIMAQILKSTDFQKKSPVFLIKHVLFGVDVIPFFPMDGRSRGGAVIMTGPYDRVVRKLHEATYRWAKGGAVTAEQIRSAAVSYKQGVAGEKIAFSI